MAKVDWSEAVEHGMWGIVNLGGLVVAVTRPVAKCVSDTDLRLHCASGPALVWGNVERYFWRGTEVPEPWITAPGSLSGAEALTWPNVEQRRAAIDIVGWARIIRDLEVREVDVDPDPQIGTLLRAKIPNTDGGAPAEMMFLRVQCGTGREFALPVPPDMTTARQANAWTYGLSPDELRPEVRT